MSENVDIWKDNASLEKMSRSPQKWEKNITVNCQIASEEKNKKERTIK